MTQTFVRFFAEDDVRGLKRELRRLRANYQQRAPYVSATNQRRIEIRLRIIEEAAELLTEAVPSADS